MRASQIRAGAAGLLLFCELAAAAPAAAQFSELRTRNLRLVYTAPFQTYLVDHVGRCFENSIAFDHRLFGYTPTEPVTVLLGDLSDTGNASTTAVPWNLLTVELSPISVAYETVSPNERFNWLMNHELIHLTTTDQAARSERRARAFFGGKVAPNSDDPETILYQYLTNPRDSAPRWYHEGIAVFLETWMAGGQGRAQGAYDEMVFRSMVRDGSRFYDPLGLVATGTRSDFQLEVNSYLYGTRFMVYLAHRFSPDAVIRWVSLTNDSKAYYARNFEHVFGMPLDTAWQDWIAFEKEFQDKNLAAIRTYPTTPSTDLSPRALGSVSRPFFDPETRKIYVAFNHPGLVAHVGSISVDDGTVTPIEEIKGPVLYTVTSLAWDPERRILFYTADNNAWRDLMSLDPATGKTKRLLKDARIGDLAFDRADRSLWGVRHFNGIATLVRIPYPYTEWNQVHSWPYGDVPYDLDVSPDGTLLSASIGGVDGLHALHVMRTADLLAGKVEDVAKFDFGTFIPDSFVFSDDGRYLYGSSYYTGVSNIFRYDLQEKKLDALSNAETGFFHPLLLPDGSMLVFRYSGRGFVPARIEPKPLEDISPIAYLGAELVEEHPELKTWQVPPPSTVDLEGMTTGLGLYKPLRSVRSESFYPILQGYKDTQAIGMRFNFSDPLQIDRFILHASYSPSTSLSPHERMHLRLEYRRYDWHVDAWYNLADFYDLFGPTKKSRKGHALEVGWDKLVLFDLPRKATLDVKAAYYGGIDQLPLYQNVTSPSDRLATFIAKFDYRNIRSSLGHVDDEKGQRWRAWAGGNYSQGTFYPQILAAYDVGFQLPLEHSSIWLRGSAGNGFGDRDNEFVQFYFGAFGNNWVDNGEVQRYREWYAFPGLDINAIGGRSFGKAILEWNLPPARFLHVGTPGFFATWARPSIFLSGLRFGGPVSDVDACGQLPPGSPPSLCYRATRTFGDAGGQIDFQFAALSRLDLTLSLGYAAEFEHGMAPNHEAMVSLKVLH